MRSSQSGFTIIELFFFVVEVALGCVISIQAGRHFGLPGYILGFVFGFALLPLLVWVLFRDKSGPYQYQTPMLRHKNRKPDSCDGVDEVLQ